MNNYTREKRNKLPAYNFPFPLLSESINRGILNIVNDYELLDNILPGKKITVL